MDGEPNATGRNRWVAAFLGLAVLWTAYLALFGPRDDRGGLPMPRLAGTGLSEPADFAWKLTDEKGQPVDLAQFRGRPIVLNLWATWCPPCRAEMPALARLTLNPKLKELNAVVICVSVDRSIDALQDFLEAKPHPMIMLHATSVPGIFQTDGIPATFIIDPAGKIVAAETGAARWDDPSVVAFLATLKAAGPGS